MIKCKIKYLALQGEVCYSPEVVALRGLILFSRPEAPPRKRVLGY